jgi:hypothetical protein
VDTLDVGGEYLLTAKVLKMPKDERSRRRLSMFLSTFTFEVAAKEETE